MSVLIVGGNLGISAAHGGGLPIFHSKIGEDAMAGSGGVAAMGREDRMKVRCRSCAARSNLRLLVNTLFRWSFFPRFFLAFSNQFD